MDNNPCIAGAPARPPSVIEGELNTHQSELDTLNEIVCNLEDRLHPILCEPPPANPDKDARCDLAVPVAARIQRQTEQVVMIINKLQELRDRIGC